MSGHRDELVSIHIQTGLRETGEGSSDFRGFCTIFCTAADGSRVIGQLDPAEVRKMALNFLGSAEAAVQDAIVMNMMVRDVGAPPSVGANLVTKMRDERHRIDPDPDDEGEP